MPATIRSVCSDMSVSAITGVEVQLVELVEVFDRTDGARDGGERSGAEDGE